MVSRERLTIIPHGVPYMTKLLRYFVSEDSIFLHLEHVQGEGTCGGPVNSRALGRIPIFYTPEKDAEPRGGVQLDPDVWHRQGTQSF